MDFVSKYVREQKRYTKDNLKQLFGLSNDKIGTFIKNLKSANVLYSVKRTAEQFQLSDLLETDIIISSEDKDDCYYVFRYVGVIAIGNIIINCYPKYIESYTDDDLLSGKIPSEQMKQIIKVLRRFASKEQIINMYNGDEQNDSFNMLAVMLYLLKDYYDNGLYMQEEDIIELNGEGAILWDKTISDGFAIIQDNVPYYVDTYTTRVVDNDYDFFQRLHRYVLTECANQLKEAGLLSLFEMEELCLSDEERSDFGDTNYILYRIKSEIDIQFSTRKQSLLKTLYAYLAQERTLKNNYGVSLFGTSSFHVIWEKTCAQILDNEFDKWRKHIEVPHWFVLDENNSCYFPTKDKEDTLIPDIISTYEKEGKKHFAIFDAKYYNIKLEKGQHPKNQPGISDVTKQFLYELVLKKYIEKEFDVITNCFLMPTEVDGENGVVKYGLVCMDMFSDLQPIQIRLLNAEIVYECYLNNKTLSFQRLKLNESM